VADQDNRPGDGPQQGGVAGQVAQGVGHGDGGEPAVAQGAITPPKPLASAQAPWTNTIVGVPAAMLATARL
jgi:hypothetical protein